LTSSYFYAYIAAFGVPKTNSNLFYTNLFYEGIFSLQILLEFITDYRPQGTFSKPVRDLSKISSRYLKGGFIYDFIPLIPLDNIIKIGGYERLFYLIKLMRFGKGIGIFKSQNIMKIIKSIFQNRLENIIKTDKYLANNMEQDNNNITTLMFINYGVKIFRLSLIILNVSLFLGLFWYIICDLTVDLKKATIKDYDTRDPLVYN